MKRSEKQAHPYDHQAKNDGNQTTRAKEHKQPQEMAACSEAQIHSQIPFAHHETSFWQDVYTLFSFANEAQKLITG